MDQLSEISEGVVEYKIMLILLSSGISISYELIERVYRFKGGYW